MQRLILKRKRLMVGLVLLILILTMIIPAAAQDSEVNGDLYVATNNDDGQLVVFWMDGDEAVVLLEETYDVEWQGWRLGSQEILLYTDDQSDDLPSNFAVVDADGLRFIEMDEDLQAQFDPPQLVNYVSPYLIFVTDVESDYSPALLVNIETATADLLTMDYRVVTPFRLSEDGEILRYAEHGAEVGDQSIVELDLDSGETTIVNTAASNGWLYPDRYGETWVEIRTSPQNPVVNLYNIEGDKELVASGTQEAFYWVVGSYLIHNTNSCSGGNCLYEFRSLRDDTTVSINAPEGIGFWPTVTDILDDGRFIVADIDTNAYWLLTVLHNPTQLGYSAGAVVYEAPFGRLSPDERWFVVESVPSPGDPDIAIRIMSVDTNTIVGTVGGNGSIHGIWFGERGILIQLVNVAVLFDSDARSISPIPNSNDTEFSAVLADNSILYSLNANADGMEAGVYRYDPSSEESTVLLEGLHLLDLK